MTETKPAPMVRRYRKKPVVIEAIEFNGANFNQVADWIERHGGLVVHHNRFNYDTENLESVVRIKTLEGLHDCLPGYMVIRGVRGEFYGCEPGIFAETYEEA